MHDDLTPIEHTRLDRAEARLALAAEARWRVPVSPRVELRVLELPLGVTIAIVMVDGVPLRILEGADA